MAALGAPPDVINRTLEAESANDDGVVEVFEENWPVVQVFLALSTQWRREFPAMAETMIWHGLHYPAVESTIRMMGLWRQAKDIFEGLLVMEAAALKLLNK